MESDSTAPSFDQLPLEVLYGIFHYLDISDILRARRVSRYLNQVSHCREVWSDAYRKAKFVRPPGPFLSQSAHDLENALVPSFRVDRNLRDGGSAPTGERSTLRVREIRYTGVDLRVNLVFGRFLLIALGKEVRCFDLSIDALDSNSSASIIYRTTDKTLRSFDCVSAIDIEGRPFACAVLSEAGRSSRDTTQISIYLLNVADGFEVSLDLLHQFERSTFDDVIVDLGPRVIVVQGSVGLGADANWCVVALDVHTRTQFLLPSLTHAIWETVEMPEWSTIKEIALPRSISTSTHLLQARSFYTQAAGWSTFLQAFALPPPNAHRHLTPLSTPLSPSHRGIISGIILLRDAVLLRDATLDPSTHDVLITVRVHAFESSRPHNPISKYGLLRLGAAHTSDGEVGTVSFRLLGALGHSTRIPFMHPSFNGTGRVFFMHLYGVISALEYDIRGDGGGGHVDEDEEPTMARVIEYSLLTRPLASTIMDYDPYSGRICLRTRMEKYSAIEILDFAV